MACIEDHSHFLAITGVPIATILYLSPCLAHKFTWLKFLLGAIVSQILYGLIASFWPDTFGYNIFTAGSTMIVFFAAFNLALATNLQITLLAALFMVVAPLLIHNVMLFTEWLRTNVSSAIAPWFGVVLFACIALALFCILMTYRVVERILLVTFVIVGTLVLFVYVRVAMLESDGSTNLCCNWSAPPDDVEQYDEATNSTIWVTPAYINNDRCPFGVDHFQADMIFLCLLFFSMFMTFQYHRGRDSSDYSQVELTSPR